MKVVANFTNENDNFTKGKEYELTENGCLDNRGFNFKYYLSASGNNLLEKWNKEWRGQDLEGIFTEVKEDTMKTFDKDDLRSGMVVEIKYPSGNTYRNLMVHSGDELIGMSLDGETFTPENNSATIIKVWAPEIRHFKGMFGRLNDDCLIFDAKRDLERERKLKELEETIEDATRQIKAMRGEC